MDQSEAYLAIKDGEPLTLGTHNGFRRSAVFEIGTWWLRHHLSSNRKEVWSIKKYHPRGNRIITTLSAISSETAEIYLVKGQLFAHRITGDKVYGSDIEWNMHVLDYNKGLTYTVELEDFNQQYITMLENEDVNPMEAM